MAKTRLVFGLVAIFLLSACPLEPISQPPSPDVTSDTYEDMSPSDSSSDMSIDEGTDLTQTTDEGTEDIVDPPPLFASETRSIWSMNLSTVSADECYPLGGEDLLIRQGNELHWMGSPGDVTLELPDGFVPEDVVAADQSGMGHLVIATQNALYVTTDNGLELSPLSEALADTTITDLIIARKIDGDILWIATSDGIQRWENDMIQSLDLGDVPSQNVQFAWGAPLNSGNPALWVNAGSHVYAITHNGTSATAWVEQSDRNVTSITVDGSGQLWMISDDGVELRQSDGYWHPAPLDFDVEEIIAHRDHVGSYVLDSEGTTHHLLDFTAWELLDKKGPLCVDGFGRLMTTDSNGLFRHHPWEDLSLSGLANGGRLQADVDSTAATVTIHLPYLDTESSTLNAADAGLEADLNGEPFELGEAPFTIEFDPWSLDIGDHILSIRRTVSETKPWDPPSDGAQVVERKLYFSSDRPEVSWTEDIEPLHMSHCNSCHGQAGHLANELKFYNFQQWTTQFNVILAMVEAQLMPPGAPLAPEEILLLKYWGLSQFPE